MTDKRRDKVMLHTYYVTKILSQQSGNTTYLTSHISSVSEPTHTFYAPVTLCAERHLIVVQARYLHMIG